MSTTVKRMKKLTIAATFIVGLLFWFQLEVTSLAFTQTTGTITGSSVKVRQEAGTTATVVASVKKGDTVDVIDAVTASDGTTWYKINVNANTKGFIRSDFVQLAGGASAPTTPTDITTPPATETITTQVTAMQSQSGTVTNDDVRVRKQASTSTDVVTTVSKGTVITLTGTATGTDNKQWYQVSFISNGSEVIGFIRSDFISLGSSVTTPTTPETPATGTTETPATGTGETPADRTEGTDGTTGTDENTDDTPTTPNSSDDYEAVYTTDENGEYVWYLYDRVEGVRYKVSSLLNLETEANDSLENQDSTILKLKIAVIVLIFVIVAIIFGVTIYIFRTRDAQYDDDDDDDEEEVVRRPVRRPISQGTATGTRPQGTRPQGARPEGSRPVSSGAPVRRPVTHEVGPEGTRPQGGTPIRRPVSQSTGAEGRHVGSRPQTQRPASGSAQRPVQGNPQRVNPTPNPSSEGKKPSWKAKNFLDDNDEFEFDFLDFDDDEK